MGGGGSNQNNKDYASKPPNQRESSSATIIDAAMVIAQAINMSNLWNDLKNLAHGLERVSDMGFFGPPFTWQRNNIKRRLDRFLCNLSYNNMFPTVGVKHLSKLKSDHLPILLDVNATNEESRDRPFRLLAPWLLHEDYNNLVKSCSCKEGDLIRNISIFTDKANVWNKEKLWKEYEIIAIQEESYWQQLSKCKAINFGEKNLSIFIKEQTVEEGETRSVALRIMKTNGQIMFPKIKETDLSLISREVTAEEVKHAVFSMGSWRAPEMDGLPANFFQHSWDIITVSLVKWVKMIFNKSEDIVRVN
ncbi:uncharacterized protein [Arachis hypogaea]|uniref:uncharacterized protein n=1 Tax=Arachis hypogaea TaxID=3818 RepID=UPI003B223378